MKKGAMHVNSLKGLLATGSLALALSLAAPQQATASTVTVCPTCIELIGTDVKFIIDTAQPDFALYGMPVVVGNSLFFSPTTFTASSTDQSGSPDPTPGDPPGPTGVAQGTIAFDIVALNESVVRLEKVMVSEAGDYQTSSLTDGVVSASAQLGAFNLSSVSDFLQDTTETGPLASDNTLETWALQTSLDFMAGWAAGSTAARITIQNNLFATTFATPASAFIQKKFEGLAITVNIIPLPAAVWMLLSALTGLAWFRRRQTIAAAKLS